MCHVHAHTYAHIRIFTTRRNQGKHFLWNESEHAITGEELLINELINCRCLVVT